MVVDDLAAWHDFYLLVGNVAAVLAGLVFVAMTLRPALTRREYARERTMARQIFGNFIGGVLVSLVMLVPGFDDTGLGLAIAVAGALGLSFSVRRILREGLGRSRITSAMVAQTLIVVSGLAVVAHTRIALTGVAVGIGAIVLLAFTATWQLIVADQDAGAA